MSRIEALETELAALYLQRDSDILDLVGDGWTLQAVADHYRMTKQRVSQMGYPAEAKAFYGDESVAQSDSAERKISARLSDWYQGASTPDPTL